MEAKGESNLNCLLSQAQAARLDNHLEKASALLEKASLLAPNSIPVLMEQGLLYQQCNQWDASRRCFQRVLSTDPENPQVLNALGHTWQAESNFNEALKFWKKAIIIQPEYADVWQNIGLAHEHLDNLSEAISAHQKVVELKPTDARAHRLLGMSQLDLGLLTAAGKCFDRALELEPENPENRWQRFFIQALTGKFPDAWADYECRFELPGRTTPDHGFRKPNWQGETLPEKTLLLYAEQGYGDTIQMVRYIEKVSKHVGKIILWVPSTLAGLMESIQKVDEVITRKPNEDTFDIQLPLMSLPGVFNDSMETIPKQIPYLENSQKEDESNYHRIGICWTGSGNQPLDRRSIPIEEFQYLFDRTDLEFHSLQIGHNPPCPLHDRSHEMIDFKATSEIIQDLDLVISIDTSIAHLTGAMGKPVWILLNFAPDWRWGIETIHSAWYPSARLFRQKYGESWSAVIYRLCQEL
tara:strand:+ start:3536 stop:4939 length:1404 start_codon:yes stop_codon:yes gene_type:complete